MKNKGEVFYVPRQRRFVSRLAVLLFLCLCSLSFHPSSSYTPNDYFEENGNPWPSESQDSLLSTTASNGAGSTKLTSLDVICGKEYMTVRAEFNGPFNGIVFSKGTYGQSKCVYVKPHSALTHTSFNVRYDECGTKPDLQGKYFENTIVIQYGTDIIEALDEAKRLRCEWFEAYEKPATFRPAIPVADLDIIEMNFQGDEIDCWMSIQEGKGPWSSEINRIVTVGQPLTIVVAINDYKSQFDMKVKSCFAHDGIKPPIYLIDEDGCVLRPKMISPFKKIRNIKGKASLISYAQFLAFKFPDSVDVQIQCTVEVCRHGCVNTCEAYESSETSKMNTRINKGNEMNHLLMNSVDLLESAASGQVPVTVKPYNVDTSESYLYNDAKAAHEKPQLSEIDLVKNFQLKTNLSHDQAELNNNLATLLKATLPGPPEKSILSSNSKGTFEESNFVVMEPNELAVMNSAPTAPPNKNNNNNLYTVADSIGNMGLQQNKQPPPVPPLLHQQQQQLPLHLPNSHLNAMFHKRPPMREPVAQVMNIPLSPMYAHLPPRHTMTPFPNAMLKPFNGMNMKNKRNLFLPQLLANYFNKNRRSQYVPNDNFEIIDPRFTIIESSPRLHRTKRHVTGKQGEVGLKRGFQVVTSLDLSFAPNMSTEQMPVYEGIPASIVYGMCFSTTHFFFFATFAMLLILAGIFSCVYIICQLERVKAK